VLRRCSNVANIGGLDRVVNIESSVKRSFLLD
jgi:hypothetical protein